jgi:hypothetical protein
MEKRISKKPTRFADEYLNEIEIDSDSGDEFESCGIFTNVYRPSYVSQLLGLYKNLFLPLRGPFVFPEAVKAKMDRICPEQPHRALFCWATQAGVDTDQHDLVKMILIAEGRVDIRERVKGKKVASDNNNKFVLVGGESRKEYVFFLNEELNNFIQANDYEATGALPVVDRSILLEFESRTYLNHSLHQLQCRLRNVVSGKTQRPLLDFGHTITAVIPLHCVVYLLPKEVLDCFVQAGAGDGGVVHPRLVAPVQDLELLDSLFPPNQEDLASDTTEDPVFKHSTKQRWWCHHRTNPSRRNIVQDGVQLFYDLRRGEMYVSGYYRKHKKLDCPNGGSALSVEWV